MPDIIIRDEANEDEVWKDVNVVCFRDANSDGLISYKHFPGIRPEEYEDSRQDLLPAPDGMHWVGFFDDTANLVWETLVDDGGSIELPPEPTPIADDLEFVRWNLSVQETLSIKQDIVVGSVWKYKNTELDDSVIKINVSDASNRTVRLNLSIPFGDSTAVTTYTVDWGDGNSDLFSVTGLRDYKNHTHTYNSNLLPGTFYIKIRKESGSNHLVLGGGGRSSASTDPYVTLYGHSNSSQYTSVIENYSPTVLGIQFGSDIIDILASSLCVYQTNHTASGIRYNILAEHLHILYTAYTIYAENLFVVPKTDYLRLSSVYSRVVSINTGSSFVMQPYSSISSRPTSVCALTFRLPMSPMTEYMSIPTNGTKYLPYVDFLNAELPSDTIQILGSDYVTKMRTGIVFNQMPNNTKWYIQSLSYLYGNPNTDTSVYFIFNCDLYLSDDTAVSYGNNTAYVQLLDIRGDIYAGTRNSAGQFTPSTKTLLSNTIYGMYRKLYIRGRVYPLTATKSSMLYSYYAFNYPVYVYWDYIDSKYTSITSGINSMFDMFTLEIGAHSTDISKLAFTNGYYREIKFEEPTNLISINTTLRNTNYNNSYHREYTVPEGVENIKNDCIMLTFDKLTLPSTLTTITHSSMPVFRAREVYVLATVPPSYSIDISNSSGILRHLEKIHVKAEAYNDYINHQFWGVFKNFIVGDL